jgi:predicted signal transduction protein with EAL and GGDEF domain
VPGEWISRADRARADGRHRGRHGAAAAHAWGWVAIDISARAFVAVAPARAGGRQIKINQSFVAGLPADTGAQAIARAVCSWRTANLTVTAEGVETEAQHQALVAMGCDELQGFLISRPLSASALSAWLAEHVALN